MAAATTQLCGFCRDPIQEGAGYVEQALCKKILFWLSDIDSKFNNFDIHQVTTTWCQVCCDLSAGIIQNLYSLSDRITPRVVASQSSSARSHANGVKQEQRNSVAGSISTTTTTNIQKSQAFQHVTSMAPSVTTAFPVAVSMAQASLTATHPAQFMAATTMKGPGPPVTHMSMATSAVPMISTGGAGSIGMVAPMMAHAPHLQTLTVNGIPCQPFYSRPDLVPGHTSRGQAVITIGDDSDKQDKRDVSQQQHEVEQGEKVHKTPAKKPRKKKEAQVVQQQTTAEGFTQDFEGAWPDSANFTNIAQSFGLMPKPEEQEGTAPGQDVSMLDSSMSSHGTPPSAKKGKKESMKFHKCFACDKQFTSQKWLRKHMEEKHNIVATFNCEVCGKKFNDRKNFRRHCRLHSEDTPYKCTICGKKCGRNKDLRNHMASHNTEKNFQCSVCGKGYKAVKALRDHMKAHEGTPQQVEQPQHPQSSASPLVLQREVVNATPVNQQPQQQTLTQELIDANPQLTMTLQNQVLMDPHAITSVSHTLTSVSHAALLQQRYAETFRTTNLADLAQTVVALQHTPPNHNDGHR